MVSPQDLRWERFSLLEQLGNVGSEVSRALYWKGKDAKLHEGAVFRGLELMDHTIRDVRWKGRRKELTRARELMCDAWFGGHEYGTTWEDLDRYFLDFAVAARLKR